MADSEIDLSIFILLKNIGLLCSLYLLLDAPYLFVKLSMSVVSRFALHTGYVCLGRPRSLSQCLDSGLTEIENT